jgi:hypothetical protein
MLIEPSEGLFAPGTKAFDINDHGQGKPSPISCDTASAVGGRSTERICGQGQFCIPRKTGIQGGRALVKAPARGIMADS